jgi:uncharacterized protein YlzI (FlbEa/FlbD family)
MADIITVHRLNDGGLLLLNRDHVVSVEETQKGCLVTLANGKVLAVQETVDELTRDQH